jgi:hypothetical protein
MTHWFSCAGSWPPFIAGAPSSPSTSPPSPRVQVESYCSGHPRPRHVAQQDHSKLLTRFRHLDLTAGDHRRRNTAISISLCSGSRPGTSG